MLYKFVFDCLVNHYAMKLIIGNWLPCLMFWTTCQFLVDNESFHPFLGPSHWGEEYGECSGKHQSPINIDSEHVTRKVLPKLKLENFHDKPKEMSITNNGHTGKKSNWISLYFVESRWMSFYSISIHKCCKICIIEWRRVI